MKTFRASFAAIHPLWKSISFVLLFNGAYFIWLLSKPVNHDLFVAVDDWGVTCALFTMSLFCFYVIWKHRRQVSASGTHWHWAPVLLSLGLLSYAFSQGIWTFEEQILHQITPFPSWADAADLCVYPFVLLAIVLLPTRPLPASSRTRIVLDGLMTMTAIVTFSWYFILGPTIEQGVGTLLAKVVGAAYPFSDLVMAFCLLILASRSSSPAMRHVLRLLSLSLIIMIIGDSILDYQNLQGRTPQEISSTSPGRSVLCSLAWLPRH